MKRNIIYLTIVIIIFSVGYFFYNKNSNPNTESLEQQVYAQTLTISKEYTSLRYQTDNVLMNTNKFSDYDALNKEIGTIIKKWDDLEKSASNLGKLAEEMTEDKISMKLIPVVYAYDTQEVNNIYQKAPNGKKIMTLAKHFGVDAKMAHLILNQAQDYSSREAFGAEGDEEEGYENAAITIKNTSKVTVFVGTIAISAPVGALAKTAVIVSGADLTLEITDDTAKMALGNKNKISAIAGDVRKITEPAAAILSIATLPNKLVEGVDKLNAVVFGADQLNSTIQAGSIIGIKLPTYNKENPAKTFEVSVLESDELEKWIKEQAPDNKTETKAEIENILEIGEIIEKKSNSVVKESEIKLIPVKEFEEIFDKEIAFEKISKVKKIFGEPDVINTLEGGYGNYVYNRRLIYPNGNIAKFTIRFNKTEVEGYSIGMEK